MSQVGNEPHLQGITLQAQLGLSLTFAPEVHTEKLKTHPTGVTLFQERVQIISLLPLLNWLLPTA